VQLSGPLGGFGSPVNIGTLSAISGGVINVTIPTNTPSGNSYRIRIVANNPTSLSSPTPAFVINSVSTAGVTISANPSGAQCAGTTFTYTASPTNGGTLPQYQWTINGTPINGANSVSFNTNTLSNNDVVKVILTSNLACVSGNPVTSSGILQVINPILTPSVSITGSSSGCEGDEATFSSVITAGGTNPQYQWRINGVEVTSANVSSFSTFNLVNNDEVSLQITSNELCVSSATAISNEINYTSNPLPIAYNFSGGGIICPNQTSIDLVLEDSQQGVDYQLLIFGSPINSPIAGTGNQIVIPVSDNGEYEIVATSSTSCSNTMNGYVYVDIDPIPSEYILTGTSPICPNASTEIILNGSDFDFLYTLYLNGNPVSLSYDGNGFPISFGTFSDPGVYTVIAQYNYFGGAIAPPSENGNLQGFNQGCETQLATSFNLSNSANPIVFNLEGPQSICSGNTATYILNGSEIGVDYTLYF
jgi:hypothetical protein